MKWYLKVVRDNYANFSGRARREEYWMFVLFNLLIMIGLVFLSLLFVAFEELAFIPGILIFIYAIGIIIPSLAVAVRRLHDTGKSGWWYLISLVPFGGIVLFIFFVIEGDKGPNQYGPDPKGSVEEIDQIGRIQQ